ncbi:MAG: ATP-dependent DNA helicase RecG [Solirubrobacterales bacterium]|nr:ATP-dependent DNA helicase RecG [Solirubrobacterales bacterium]HMT05092.1 ATP-dependent DNA helicase RecG [Solirubrobacterales bacterium]
MTAATLPSTPPPRFGGGSGDRPGREELLAAGIRWRQPSLANRDLSLIPGVGEKFRALASETGIETVGDLLWRVPRAYGHRPGTGFLEDLEPGEPAAVEVRIVRARKVRTRRRRFSVVEARVADDSGARKAVWFNQPWMAEKLIADSYWYLEGRMEKNGLVVSASEPLQGQAIEMRADETVAWQSGAARPPGLAADALRSAHSSGGEIGPGRWRRWSFEACRLASGLPDPLPARLMRRKNVPGLKFAGLTESFREAHFPAGEERAGTALRRLAYQELLESQVRIRERRLRHRQRAGGAEQLDGGSGLASKWLANLPFDPTSDQRNAIATISSEISGTEPMGRLLMGEVGSGKTVVAIHAMLETVGSGAQAAFMAPTEVLAGQHFATLAALLEGTGVKVALLTGSTRPAERAGLLAGLAEGEIAILVGTHALLEQPVRFRRLGLAVVDEEHRFGVRQRGGFDRKAPPGQGIHLLHMSATPIPRTLALTEYGDLDVTTLRELPAGRVPVTTEVYSEARRSEAFDLLRTELDRGRQAFIVCPLVEESPMVEGRAAAAEAERLSDGELAGYEVGLLHGQMKPAQKEVAMAAFADRRIDVLVATTVIEVGIDVPNATVMVIEGADRFGLSQLHQLRGRIGRGVHGGSCLLFSQSSGPRAARRLGALASTSDGFKLAELDLEMRGEGEVAGTRQHGLPRFRVAALPRDIELLETARQDLASMDELELELLSASIGPGEAGEEAAA